LGGLIDDVNNYVCVGGYDICRAYYGGKVVITVLAIATTIAVLTIRMF